MPRLRRVDCGAPGITRKRRGRGFAYYGPDGTLVRDPETLARIKALVLPPAWRDVWICPWPNGHVQALGTDAAGRRQYRYHDLWRQQRDAAKHERVLAVAARLPQARQLVGRHLCDEGPTRQRVLACAFRLLDLGFFRVGSEQYAEDNGTFGLATMLREHVTVEGDVIVFEYTAKSGKHRVQSVVDPAVRTVVEELLARSDPGEELLAYQELDEDGVGWHDVRSSDVNSYLREVVGADISAKDFRTWHATVLMAVGLAVSVNVASSPTGRKKAVARAVKEVSDYLGNTPAVCRSSYIDPRVIDLFDDGITIAPVLGKLGADAGFGQPATHGEIEAAVLKLLSKPEPAATKRRLARTA